MRTRNLAVLTGFGLAATGLTLAALRAGTTARVAREALSEAGGGPENLVPLRVNIVDGRPRFTAIVITEDQTVKLVYKPAEAAWAPFALIGPDGTAVALPTKVQQTAIYSRKELEELVRDNKPIL